MLLGRQRATLILYRTSIVNDEYLKLKEVEYNEEEKNKLDRIVPPMMMVFRLTLTLYE